MNARQHLLLALGLAAALGAPAALAADLPNLNSTTAEATPALPTPPANGTRVLIVTGMDYPAHKWQETTPIIQSLLQQDLRLKVAVTENPAALARLGSNDWDVVVLHFQNWEQPGPGQIARDHLQRFVENGGGLVSVHFACGAWHDEWPEFTNLLGRVWHGSGPNKPQHDPRGPFLVEFTNPQHPITRGLENFTTTDELYTCLTGSAPIQLLAQAKSKVDQRYHPQAFVRDYGKGRVFLTTLGHDVMAYTNHPTVGEMLRRGTAWAAGLSATTAK